MAITAKLLNTMKAAWETYYPDTNQNGTIEKLDVSTIADKILVSETATSSNIPTSLMAGAFEENIPIEVIYSKTVFILDDAMAIYDDTGNLMFGDNPVINIIEE